MFVFPKCCKLSAHNPFLFMFLFRYFFLLFPLTLVWLLIPLLLLLIAIECFNTIQTSKYLVSFMSMSNVMCVLRSSEKWRFAFLSEVRSNSVRQRFSSFDISYGVVSKQCRITGKRAVQILTIQMLLHFLSSYRFFFSSLCVALFFHILV